MILKAGEMIIGKMKGLYRDWETLRNSIILQTKIRWSLI